MHRYLLKKAQIHALLYTEEKMYALLCTKESTHTCIAINWRKHRCIVKAQMLALPYWIKHIYACIAIYWCIIFASLVPSRPKRVFERSDRLNKQTNKQTNRKHRNHTFLSIYCRKHTYMHCMINYRKHWCMHCMIYYRKHRCMHCYLLKKAQMHTLLHRPTEESTDTCIESTTCYLLKKAQMRASTDSRYLL